MITRHYATRFGLLASLGAVTSVLLSGCGGTTTNGDSLRATVPSGPIIYGLQATAAVDGVAYDEVSGLASADAKTPYLTAATAYTGTILQSYGTLPVGFSPSGSYIDGSIGTAVAPGASVIFGAAISNGNSTTQIIPINPSSVTLTSSEVPSFKQALTFTNSTTGPLANATYRTAAFPLPFTTTGLHSLTASVADTAGNTGTTTFDTVVVTSSAVAFYTGVTLGPDPKNPGKTTTTPINPGDVAELDNATTGVKVASVGTRDQATADANGVVILFVPPGTYTFKTTSADGKTVTVQQDAAGKTAVLDLTKAGGTAVVQ